MGEHRELEKSLNKFDAKRQAWNLELLTRVSQEIQDHPELRFEQILWNMGLCGDHFYEEPWDTAVRLDNLNAKA